MEVDWEFEVGGDAPVLDARWSGFVDLQKSPELARGLPEVGQLPTLAAILERLNADSSPVWTAKCDFYPALQPEEFDRDELNAPQGSFVHAMSCYIDLHPKMERAWSLPHQAEAMCKQLCRDLGSSQLRCCRADLVIRRAIIDGDGVDLGITAYITACGSAAEDARDALEAALAAFADALCPHSTLQ